MIIYWVSYLEQYQQQYQDYSEVKASRFTNFADIYDKENYQATREYFEIDATGMIFFEKLGKHAETSEIFKILGFKAVPEVGPAKTYTCKKDKESSNHVRIVLNLLKQVSNMEL